MRQKSSRHATPPGKGHYRRLKERLRREHCAGNVEPGSARRATARTGQAALSLPWRQVNRSPHPRGQGPSGGGANRLACSAGARRCVPRSPPARRPNFLRAASRALNGSPSGCRSARCWLSSRSFAAKLTPPPRPFRHGRGRRAKLESAEQQDRSCGGAPIATAVQPRWW